MRHAGDVRFDYTTGHWLSVVTCTFYSVPAGRGSGLALLSWKLFLSGLELWELIQFIYGGRVILMSDTFNARALFLAVWSKPLFTFLFPFAKTLPFSRVSFREVTPSISSS